MKDGYYRIKTWAEMEQEYGLASSVAIDCEWIFTIEMEQQMPEDRVIQVNNNCWKTENNFWGISEEMTAEYLGKEKEMKFKVGDEVRILMDTSSLKKGSIGVITAIDRSYRIEGVDNDGDDDYNWYKEDQIELAHSSYKTPITYPVPDWFTWGYEHECYVSNKSEEDALKHKVKRIIYAVLPEDVTLYPFRNGESGGYKYAVPVPKEEPTPSIIDTILEGTDFGCRKEDVKKVLTRLADHLKGDKE
jgi:hypothetical protein